GIGQLAPSAAAVALGQEQACRIAFDRRTEKVRQARTVGRQGLARAAVQSAVAARLADDAWARVSNRAQPRRCRHLASSPLPPDMWGPPPPRWGDLLGRQQAPRRMT